MKKEGSEKVVKFDLLSLFAGRESCVKRPGHAMFHNTPVKAGIFLDILNLRSFDHLFKFHSALYVSQHRSLIAIGQKTATSHSLVFTTDTRTCNRDREASSEAVV